MARRSLAQQGEGGLFPQRPYNQTRKKESLMFWLLWAIASRLFWAGTTFVEQFLSRAHEGQSSLAPLALMSVLYLPFSILSYLLSDHETWPVSMMLYSLGAVVIVFAAMVPYFHALRREPAHDVVPYLELTPVFVIAFAVILKHQHLGLPQSVGAALVVGSSFLFSWNFKASQFKFAILALLALSSLGFAGYQFCNAEAEARSSVWETARCFYFGQFCMGSTLLLFSKKLRNGVMSTFAATSGRTALFALATNILELSAFLALLSAFRQAPTYGHVAALSGLQSVFCFLLALPLGRYLPQYFTPVRFDREQSVKLSLIGTICVGVYLLAR